MNNKPLVFQSDFGLVDGAVAAMQGVSLTVNSTLRLYNLTHEITAYDITEASYRLFQTAEYWPKGTVFVSVVDPGVGSSRKSVVAYTDLGHYIVTPDNGTLTHIKRYVGIKEIREIDTDRHMRGDSKESYTFHGRDLYAYVGAKIACGMLDIDDIGNPLAVEDIVEVTVGEIIATDNSIKGCIDILDVRFGSLWTNITKKDFMGLGIEYGDKVEILIHNGPTLSYNNRVTFGRSFADVHISEQLVYVNSLDRMAVAINQGNFAKAYSIGTGINWTIEFKKV